MKKDGEFIGAVTTDDIAFHNGLRVFMGKISLNTVYIMSMKGYAPVGSTAGMSFAPA